MPSSLGPYYHSKHQHGIPSPNLSIYPSTLTSYHGTSSLEMQDTKSPRNQSSDVTREASLTPLAIKIPHDIPVTETDFQLGFPLSKRASCFNSTVPICAHLASNEVPQLDTSVMVVDGSDVLGACWREILSSSCLSRTLLGEESMIDVDEESNLEMDVDEGYCDEMDADAAIRADTVWIQIHALITGDITQRAGDILAMRKSSVLRSRRSGEVLSEMRPTVRNRIRMRKTSTTRHRATANLRG